MTFGDDTVAWMHKQRNEAWHREVEERLLRCSHGYPAGGSDRWLLHSVKKIVQAFNVPGSRSITYFTRSKYGIPRPNPPHRYARTDLERRSKSHWLNREHTRRPGFLSRQTASEI